MHQFSAEDAQFKQNFERGILSPSQFTHRAHIQLAYIYLCEAPLNSAMQRMQHALQNFLAAHNINPAKYHETVTRAWMMVVEHFMVASPPQASAAQFIQHNKRLLDFNIMLTHYSEAVLFSDDARVTFVEPDLEAIP